MGASLSNDCGMCWDPEGTAKIIRAKKAQKTTINKYTELLHNLDDSLTRNDTQQSMVFLRNLQDLDANLSTRPPEFVSEMKRRDQWADVTMLRGSCEQRAKQFGLIS